MVSVIIKRTIVLHLLLIAPQDTEWYCGKGNLNTPFFITWPASLSLAFRRYTALIVVFQKKKLLFKLMKVKVAIFRDCL